MSARLNIHRHCVDAFTLVELLVSMAVLSVLMLVVVQVTNHTNSLWRTTTSKVDQFREATDAFEAMERNLAQATLNTYLDYYDDKGDRRTSANAASFVPARYGRYSDLRFQTGPAHVLLNGEEDVHPGHAVFFMAPLGFTYSSANDGLNELLNTWGYYLEYRPDTDKPSFIGGEDRYRFRLMEFMLPTEALRVYNEPNSWINAVQGGVNSHVVASNIIALVVLPKLPSKGSITNTSVDAGGSKLAPLYAYDSNTKGQGTGSNPDLNSLHQLPPIVEITMVAIAESSAALLDNGEVPPDFGLDNLFQSSDPEQRREDLQTLQNTLVSMNVSFRVFSTEVGIRGAKWSRE